MSIYPNLTWNPKRNVMLTMDMVFNWRHSKYCAADYIQHNPLHLDSIPSLTELEAQL